MPILFSVKDNTCQSFSIHFLIYMILESIGLFFLSAAANYKMINCTIQQIANIFMYSQIWWIIFCPITWCVSSRAINCIFLPVIPLIVFTAKRLGSMIIPEDISLFYSVLHAVPALLIFCWTFIKIYA